MTKNFKFKNTFVVGFDDTKDPKRLEVIKLLLGSGEDGGMPDWLLFTTTDNVFDNHDVKNGDQFRELNLGYVLTVLEVGYSLELHKPFAVCEGGLGSYPTVDYYYFSDLLDPKVYGKMNQNKDVTDEQ